jgi:hypothetical protein
LVRLWRAGEIRERAELADLLPWHAGIAAFLGLAAIIMGWRLAMRTGEYDPSDPKEPRMKF